MSEFSVHRTADRIPALRYCLVLDGTRIAGGKPDYRGDNHLISWQTDETYGPVNDLMAENRKLRELATGLYRCWQGEGCEGCPMQDDGGWCVRDIQLRKLELEVD